MNLDTVRKCAEIAAAQRMAVVGLVDEDIAQLLAELAPVAEEPAPVVEAVVEAEPVAEEAPAEEAAAEEAPAAE